MSRPARPHLLIFEPDPRGHTPEWLDHLLHFAAQESAGIDVTFAIAPDLADRLEAALGGTEHPHIRFQRLEPHESTLCLSPHLAVSGFARWWTMRRHLKWARASHGLFLSIDHLSLPLALGLRAAGRSLSGVLFRPSVHYVEFGDDEPRPRERIRDLRKRILYRLMLRNPALTRLLSLDPYFPRHAAGFRAGGRKVEALADPAFPLPPGRSEEFENVAAGRKLFFLFGSLTERKGVLVLLDALLHMHPLAADRCAVLIAGRLDPALRAPVAERLVKLAKRQPSLWIKLDDRHLPVDELAALVRRSDVVLAPYQRFVGSSGVMIWAVNAAKPIITQDYGLLGKLARDYALGDAIDTTNPLALAASMESIIHNGTEKIFDPAIGEAFLADRAPHNFAAKLFDGAAGGLALRVPEIHPTATACTGHASSLS